MHLEDYPPDKEIKEHTDVYCMETGLSGQVWRVFGKKCSIWLHESDHSKRMKLITFHQKHLIKSTHPDYKRNYDSGKLYEKHGKNIAL